MADYSDCGGDSGGGEMSGETSSLFFVRKFKKRLDFITYIGYNINIERRCAW